MANRIKGITVEIGGDVTGLDKALKGVNSNIKDTQKNLKDVEKLLKLDPSNVALLEQKQRLLGKSTDDLRKKQEALNKALDGVTVSDQKWEEWQKAQAGYARQTKEVESRLVALNKRQKELEQQGFKPDSEEMVILAKRVEIANSELKLIEDQSKRTFDELGKPISQDNYDMIQRELSETTVQLKEAEKAADRFNPTLEKVGATAAKVADKANAVSNATKGISTAAGIVSGALIGMATSAGMAADELSTAAKQSGFSTDTLQEWEYASGRIDVSTEAMIAAATKLKRNMTSSSADVVKAFADLGVGVTDNAGKLRDVEGVFNDVVFGLSLISNETERDTVAMTLFGRGADELAGVIDDGGAALRAYGQEARDLGLILSQDALDGANAFNDGLDTIKARAKAAFMEAGASLAENLLPELEKLVDSVTAVLQWFASLDGSTMKLVFTIGLLTAAISPVAKVISGVGNAINGVSGIASLFANTAGNSVWLTFAKWALIITAVVAAVTTLIALIGVLTGKGEDINRTLGNLSGASKANIPGMANGGVLTSGTALVGEAGPELLTMSPRGAVVQPLTNTQQQQPVMAAQKTDVNIQFTGSLAQLGRVLQPVVTAETQRQGISLIGG